MSRYCCVLRDHSVGSVNLMSQRRSARRASNGMLSLWNPFLSDAVRAASHEYAMKPLMMSNRGPSDQQIPFRRWADFETEPEDLPAAVRPGSSPHSGSGETSITFVSEESTDDN